MSCLRLSVKFKVAALLLIGFIHLLSAQSVFAHSRGESFSKWTVGEESIEMQFTIKLKDVNKLGRYFQAHEPGWQQRFKKHIIQGIQLADNRRPCAVKNDPRIILTNQFLKIDAQYSCASNSTLSIENKSIFPFDSRHMHIARVYLANGEVAEKVLLSRDNYWQFTGDTGEIGLSQGSGFLNYLIIGMEHIVTGWDHLAFLMAVLMLVLAMDRSLKTLLILITGFSIGHSFSLILMVLGYLSPNGSVVESLIAFSIVLVAFEVIALRDSKHFSMAVLLIGALSLYALIGSQIFFVQHVTLIPLATLLGLGVFVGCYFGLSQRSGGAVQLLLTLVFGLIHGFGFAGSLQEIGLPADRLLWPLLGFNLGVELGQIGLVLLVVAMAIPVLKKLAALKQPMVFELAAAILCAVGSFWFIERSFA